jgi:predicted PurR-regulated permease PerM
MASDSDDSRTIKIAPETILLVSVALIAVILFLQVLSRIQFVIIILLMAVILAQAVAPFVKVLQGSRFSRTAAVIMAYLIIALFLVVIAALLMPSLVHQVQVLVDNLPILFERLQVFLSVFFPLSQTEIPQQFEDAISQITANLTSLLPSLLLFPLQVSSIIVAALLVLVLSLYWLLASQQIRKYIIFYVVAPEDQDEVEEILAEMERRVGGWVRGQVILSLSIGIMTFIALSLLGMPYSLLLSIWAAITELIPIAGPIIGAVPAVIVAFLISPFQALLVIIAYIIIQQLENHLLVPNVMSREVGLHPLVVILALLIGGELLGLIGAILAVPIAAALQVLVTHLVPRLHREQPKG